ncbi:MAG: ABC transporter substrate-binding protein [Deltaproteobacteria bacterium]|nr:ABC transporter substrate-binding protein [Deltaproteobacteria bacterium]
MLNFLKTLLTAVLALSSAACKSPEIPADTAVVLIETAPRTMDPLWATDAISQNIGTLIHAALVRLGPDLRPAPDLASRWETQGYRRFAFFLREGLKFQDGSPLTSEDAARALREFSDRASGSPHTEVFSRIRDIRTEGPLKIAFETDVPQPFLLSDLSLVKIFKRLNGRIVGAGRFTLTAEEGDRIALERFPGFPEPPREGALKKIIFRVVHEDATRYQLLLRGDGNVILNGLSLTTIEHLRRDPPRGIRVDDAPGANVSYLAMNFRDPRLAKLEVRQAIASAIDVPAILKNRFGASGYRSTGLLAPMQPDYEREVKTYGFDPTAAEKLLDRAGFARKQPGGMRFTLEFKTTGEKTALDFARIIAENLNAVGIEVRIRTAEFGTFYSDIRRGNFQIFASRWIGITNPSILYRVFHGSQIGLLNRGGYSNARLDPVLERAMVEPDDAKRLRLFSEAQKIVADDLPYVFLWHWNNTLIHSDRIAAGAIYPNGSFLTLAALRRSAQ